MWGPGGGVPAFCTWMRVAGTIGQATAGILDEPNDRASLTTSPRVGGAVCHTARSVHRPN